MLKSNSLPSKKVEEVKEEVKEEEKVEEVKEEEKVEEVKEEEKVELEEREKSTYNLLCESMKKNYIFFLALLFCLYKFKQNKKYTSSYIQLFLSFLAIAGIGHFAHFASHHVKFTTIYKNSDNLFTQNKYLDNIITWFCSFLDFHDTTHHDTSVNKEWQNIIYEILNNLLTQGIGLVLFIKMIDIRVIILWAFMYATVHNINYLFVKPSTHSDHHLNCTTNYGIDFTDIIFNTKYNIHDVEEHNHAAINLLLVAYIIAYFTE